MLLCIPTFETRLHLRNTERGLCTLVYAFVYVRVVHCSSYVRFKVGTTIEVEIKIFCRVRVRVRVGCGSGEGRFRIRDKIRLNLIQ